MAKKKTVLDLFSGYLRNFRLQSELGVTVHRQVLAKYARDIRGAMAIEYGCED